MTVLITGATGFIGSRLTTRLLEDGRFVVRRAVRRSSGIGAEAERVVVQGLAPEADWAPAVGGVDVVVHLAARVHLMRDRAADPLAEFRRVNVCGTERLARQAAAAGVSRFIFLSSVKVNGEVGVYTEADAPRPTGAYAVSKHEAEQTLRQVARDTDMEVVVIRPPLVYGPGVRANFRALTRAVARGVPLPLGAIHNRRSLVALDNLVDFVVTCLGHPAAADQTFLVSDGEDLSTTDLIRRLARAMGRPSRLVPVPESVLLAAAAVLGKRHVARRLLGSLQVDISKARRVVGWTPPCSVDDALQQIAASL